ncbi:MAG: hypothetical protein HYT71_02190 [Candidatus Aenigmarchaeota archaeon]|nr:hypothetical protein [Candidatus Aenigmarchaeota archaeon]
MKGITPVIALVMLMLITVGIVGTAFIWFSGLLRGSSEDAISIPNGGVYCLGANIYVMVLNLGASSSITNADIKVFKVDSADVAVNIPGGSMNPGEAKSITGGYPCGGTCAGATHNIAVGTATNVVQTRVTCK